MKRTGIVGVTIGVALLAAATWGKAEQTEEAMTPAEATPEVTAPAEGGMETASAALAEAPLLYRATDLIGKPIQDLQGTARGTVHDIVLMDDRQNVAYVAAALEEFPDRFHQIPLADIRLAPDGQAVVSDLSEARLGTLTSFARDAWPTGHAERTLGALMGLEVRDAEGKTVCRIRDILLDSGSGAVSEATVGIGGLLGIGEKFASLEWRDIALLDAEHHARTQVAAEQLKDRAYVKGEYWQRLGFGGEREEVVPPATPEETPEAMPDRPKHPSAY